MKRPPHQLNHLKRRFRRIPRGVTLVEAMIALLIFTASAAALGSAYVHMAKHTERNSYEIAALNAIQSVAEQIQSLSYDDLDNSTLSSFNIKLTAWDSAANKTMVQTFPITWATNPTTFENIGVHENEATPIIHGILYNIIQRKLSTTTTVHERRYMPVRVNATRKIESLVTTQTTLKRVRVLLRYQWAIPGRFGANGTPIYSNIKEIRIIRSAAGTY